MVGEGGWVVLGFGQVGGGERKRVALQGRETSSFPASACPGEDVHCFVLFF